MRTRNQMGEADSPLASRCSSEAIHRFLCVLFLTLGAFGLFPPLTASADDVALSGSGTEADPYKIGTVEELTAFTNLVNGGNTAICAKLTDNIGSEASPVTTMIGTDQYPYTGIFDGSGKTLYVNLTGTGQKTAPFHNVQGATIRNLRTAGTVAQTATSGTNPQSHASGLVGGANGVTIENCEVATTISFTLGNKDVHSGGFIGHAGDNNTGDVNICHSAFNGKFVGTNGTIGIISGMVGWGGNKITINNCLVAGSADNLGTFGPLVGQADKNPTGQHNYYNSDVYGVKPANTKGDATAIDAERLKSGETAWYLQNGNKSLVWGQKLGTDDYPSFTTDTNNKVYQITVNCDDKVTSYQYANSGQSVTLVDPDGLTIKSASYTSASSTTSEEIKAGEDGKFIFTMPAADVNVKVTGNFTDFAIHLDKTDNGSISSENETANVGETVTLTAHPSAGYALSGLVVKDASGNTITTSFTNWYTSNNSVIFTMPASEVTVTPTFSTGDGLYINIPKTDTITANIPEGVTSFKVYDDGGKDGNYSENCNGYLVLSVPKGYVMMASGNATATGILYDDNFSVYDGNTTSSEKLISKAGNMHGQSLSVTSSGTCMMLYFHSDGYTEYSGIDLTVTLAKSDEEYGITVNKVENGSVTTDINKSRINGIITLSVKPADGYELQDIGAKDANGNSIVTKGGKWYNDNTATFKMPASDVTVTPVFVKADGLCINIPITDTVIAVIPDSVSSFKVYDSDGKGVDRSHGNSLDGCLQINVPEGYIMQINGKVENFNDEFLYIYDSKNASPKQLINKFGSYFGQEVTVTSTGSSVLLYTHSDSWLDIDLTVSLVKSDTEFNIVVNKSTGGEVSFDSDKATANSTVTLTVHPDDGYLLQDLIVKDSFGSSIASKGGEWYNGNSDKATFSMPASNVTITPVFTKSDALYITMPKIGTKTATIPDGVTSFKVYDDGGKDGNTSDCDGYLIIKASKGNAIRLNGNVSRNKYYATCLIVYDGDSVSSPKLFDKGRKKTNVNVTSSGETVMLRFYGRYNNAYGLDLTATIDNIITFIYNGKVVSKKVVVKGNKMIFPTDKEILGDDYKPGCYKFAFKDSKGNVVDESTTVGGPMTIVCTIDESYILKGSGTPEDPCAISNIQDLTVFTHAVNSGNYTAICGKMTDNIGSASNPVTTMIGTEKHPFAGTFDGSGKTLTVAYDASEACVAPFKYISGATIKDLHVAGTINSTYTASQPFAAGVVSMANGSNNVMSSVRSSVKITTSKTGDITSAGMVAVANGTTTFKNCYFDGSIVASNNGQCVAAFVGWAGAHVDINNCYSIGTFSVASGDNHTFSRNGNNVKVNNSYYLNGFNDNQGTAVNLDLFKSGEVARKLQDANESPVWGQKLGSDDYPIFTTDIKNKVYQIAINCNEQFKSYQYANSGQNVALSSVGLSISSASYSVTGSTTSEEIKANKEGKFILTMPAADVNVNAVGTLTEIAIHIDKVSNGCVTPDKNEAKFGETITLTAHPAYGYALSGLTVRDASGNAITNSFINWYTTNDSITFTMPASEVIVTPTFSTGDELSINIPRKGTVTAKIPDGVKSFKVYDEGGKDNNYGDDCDGSLIINFSKGSFMQIVGYVNTTDERMDGLSIYDGNSSSATPIVNNACYYRQNINVKPSGSSIMLYFHSNQGINDEGVNLTMEFIAYTVNFSYKGKTIYSKVLTYGSKIKDFPTDKEILGDDYKPGYYKFSFRDSEGNVVDENTTVNRPMTIVCTLEESYVLEDRGTADNPYEIKTLDDYNIFAYLVNNVNAALCAKMTGSVGSEESPATTMIGTDEHPYTGTFDGTGHTLTVNITGTGQKTAPFHNVQGATIRNLRTEGNITQTGTSGDNPQSHASGLVGGCNGVTIDSCEVATTISFNYNGDVHSGGFIGHAGDDNPADVNITNSAFTGKIVSTGGTINVVGGLIGWGGNKFNISNCLVAGSFENVGESGAIVGREQKTLKPSNNFYSKNIKFTNQLGNAIPADSTQLADGEVAYKLGWGEKVGTDALPSPVSKDVVYKICLLNKDNGEEVATLFRNYGDKITAQETNAIIGSMITTVFDTDGNRLLMPLTVDSDKTYYFRNHKLTIGEESVTTYYSDYDLDFTGTPLKAYTAIIYDESTVYITRKDKIPAYTGILIMGEPGSYTLPEGDVTGYLTDFLTGSTAATTINATDGEVTNLVLTEDGKDFVTASDNTAIPANGAWLQVKTSVPNNPTSAKLRIVIIDSKDLTSIQNLKFKIQNSTAVYSLQGQKVADSLSDIKNHNVPAGIYIVNGKKVVIK